MSTSVFLESPPGTRDFDRIFDQGAFVRVWGKMTGNIGFGEPNQRVTMAITGGLDYYDEDWTNLLGHYFFDFQLPFVNAKALITVTAYFSLVGIDQIKIPIAVGNATPDPISQPEPGPDWPDPEKTLGYVGGAIIVGAAVLGGIYLFSQRRSTHA